MTSRIKTIVLTALQLTRLILTMPIEACTFVKQQCQTQSKYTHPKPDFEFSGMPHGGEKRCLDCFLWSALPLLGFDFNSFMARRIEAAIIRQGPFILLSEGEAVQCILCCSSCVFCFGIR